MTKDDYTPPVTTEDRYARFRAELRRRRDTVLNMKITEAAREAGVSAPWWNNVERGYEMKRGTQFPTEPTRTTIIKMARAVQWDPGEALLFAGERPLTPEETAGLSTDPRDELAGIAYRLTDDQVRALTWSARAMANPAARVPSQLEPDGDSDNPGGDSLWEKVDGSAPNVTRLRDRENKPTGE